MACRWPGLLLALAVAFAFDGSGAARAQAPAPASAAFVHVNVVPMDRERVLGDQTVVVHGDRIVAIGPAMRVAVPAGAVRINGRGKFLIPGLADMHAHVPGVVRLARLSGRAQGWEQLLGKPLFTEADRQEAERMLLLDVATGVTTVRIMSGSADMLVLKARAAAGKLLSPRLYVATSLFAAGGLPRDSIVHFVATAKAIGYDLIKIYDYQSVDLDSLAAAAQRVGLTLAGHAPNWMGSDSANLTSAFRTYTSIEHLTRYLGAWGEAAPSGDPTRLQALAVRTAQAGVWNCPTQLVVGFNVRYFNADTIARWPEMQYVTDSTRRRWANDLVLSPDPLGETASPTLNEGGNSSMENAVGVMTARRRIIKALQDAGAGLLLGSDPGVPGSVPGFAVHRELEELVKAGLTPYEALVTGTRNVAAYFGTLDSTGTVAVGKRADLVLLSGNPLRDIHATTQRAGVMLGGRWLPQAQLERRLMAVRGTLY